MNGLRLEEKGLALKVRIVVLNWNGQDLLPQCLPSLVESIRSSPFPARLTVLDNLSTDQGLSWVRSHYPQLEIVTAPENACLVSFNAFLRGIDDDIAIMMNNDIRVDSDFIGPLVKVFEKNPDAFLACPRIFTFDGTRLEGTRTRVRMRWGMFTADGRFPGHEKIQDLTGYTFSSGFGAFHRKRFLALGGYDPLYLPGILEDADLGFRAWRQGYRSFYVPESRVYHLGQASFKKVLGERGIQTLAHRNTFLFMWKNMSDTTLWAEHVIFLIPRIAYALLCGKREWAKGLFEAVKKSKEAFEKRQRFEKRIRSDREIFRLANEQSPRRRYVFKKKWRRWAMGAWDGVGSLLHWGRAGRPKLSAPPKKILVVRIDSLGDGVLTLPAIESLRKRFPEAQMDFLVSMAVYSLYISLFPQSRFYVIQSDWLDPRCLANGAVQEFRRIQRDIKISSYDLAVDFRGDLRTALLMKGAKIPNRWAREGSGGRYLLTHSVPLEPEKHSTEQMLNLVGGGEAALPTAFAHLAKKGDRLKALLSAVGDKKKIIFHVGAGYPSKRWPPERFAELARRIESDGLGVPIFTGTRQEKYLLDPCRNALPQSAMDLTGQTSLAELLALFKEADLFIGNDSGPAHLAALMDCKTLLVFSGTNGFREWAPLSQKCRVLVAPVPCSPCEERTCPLKRQACLEDISAEEVFHAAKEMLSG